MPDGGHVHEEDQHHHFLTMLGDLSAAATMAGIPIEVTTVDGDRFFGLPDAKPATDDDADAFDDTGYDVEIRIDGRPVSLGAVVEFRVPFGNLRDRDETVPRPFSK